MKPPQTIEAYCAYDPEGKPDVDFLRRNASSCHSAVSNHLGVPWLACVRLGWAVRRVQINPSDMAEPELDRPALVTPVKVMPDYRPLAHVPVAVRPAPPPFFVEPIPSGHRIMLRCGSLS